MKTIANIIFSFLLVGLTVHVSFGQNISDDADELLTITANLDNMASMDEATLIESTASLLTILNSYDEPLDQEVDAVKDLDQLLVAYNKNATLKNLLEASTQLSEEVKDSAWVIAKERLAIRQQQPRYKILNLLRAKEAMSPAEYLSIKNTLQKYQLPTNTQVAAKRIVANPAKSLPGGGLVGAELEFVSSLFQVVLNNASKEIAVTYLENLLEKETPNLTKLFPNVIDRFNSVEVNYSDSFINRLRQAFFEDLQEMRVRLPLLMLDEQYFASLQSDPIAYNLLALYTILGMVQNEVPLEETVPVTHRYIYQSYIDVGKEMNDSLASNHYQTEDYQELVELVVDFKKQLKKVHLLLMKQEIAIGELGYEFMETADKPIADDFLTAKSDLEILLNGDNSAYDLFLLPSLLKGEFEGSISDYNSLEYYDHFFGKEFTATQKRAAGLELVRNLSGTWYQEKSMVDILEEWQTNLDRYQQAIEDWRWEVGTDTLLAREAIILDKKRDSLYQRIIREKNNFWPAFFQSNDTLSFNRDDHLAFDLLGNIIKDFNTITYDTRLSGLEKQRLKEEKLQAVQDRVVALSWSLKEKYNHYAFSPIDLQTIEQQKDASILTKEQIEQLGNQLISIEQQLKVLDERVGKISYKRNNAIPILQSTELMTGFLYGLKDNNAQTSWLPSSQLTTLLDNGPKENLFLGLLQQTLGSVNNIGLVSPAALSNFTRLTIQELAQLKTPMESTGDNLDSLKKFRVASFVVHTLNNLLELPLLLDQQSHSNFIPLTERHPSLRPVPATSCKVLDFIHALDSKDHSRAVSSLLRVMTTMDTMTMKVVQGEKSKDALSYLRRYGNFIADLIDATEKGQMTDLITGITAPPGSSRIKRRRPFSIGVNAYLGANVGREIWQAKTDILAEDDVFTNVAPSVPIGITFSRRFGQIGKQHSWSLFASILDIGSLFSYRTDADAVGESEFNFSNMIKPGVQLQYNFPKSPFYVGAGVQFGPQRRQVNEKGVNINSTRYFLGFGVDVPLLSLYQQFEE